MSTVGEIIDLQKVAKIVKDQLKRVFSAYLAYGGKKPSDVDRMKFTVSYATEVIRGLIPEGSDSVTEEMVEQINEAAIGLDLEKYYILDEENEVYVAKERLKEPDPKSANQGAIVEVRDVVPVLGKSKVKREIRVRDESVSLPHNFDVDAVRFKDANGETFTGTSEGENLVSEAGNLILIPPMLAPATQPFEEVNWKDGEILLFLVTNFAHLKPLLVNVPDQDIYLICYHRYLAVHLGLVSPLFATSDFHVDYNDCVWASEKEFAAGIKLLGADNGASFLKLATEDQLTTLRLTFTDRVCLVAFVFRTRAHHYTDDLLPTYANVWAKTRHARGSELIAWKLIAVNALHAIFPILLERFWKASIDGGLCNGALVKRFDSAAAGCAGAFVINQGLADIRQIAVGVDTRLASTVSYLEELIAQLKGSRYAGSVNHRYYGVARVRVDESRLGTAASLIKAALDGLAPEDPLGKSAALRRIAGLAPITGRLLARAVIQLPQRPEVIEPLLRE